MKQRNLFSGPGYANADLSLLKSIVIREPYRLEGRVECFDILNHPNLTSFISSDLSSTATSVKPLRLSTRAIFSLEQDLSSNKDHD